MYELSRKEKDEVERNLKDFAFEQSPMFKQNLTQGMAVKHTHYLYDNWDDQLPENISKHEQDGEIINVDQTIVELGFDAARQISPGSRRPIYKFAARLIVSTMRQPSEVVMSDAAWEEVIDDFSLHDEDEEEEETVKKSEIIEMLADGMVNCQKYRQVDFDYDTREGQILLNEESGYIIADAPYGVIETHPFDYELEGDIDDDVLLKSIDEDKVVTNILFEDTVRQLRDEYQESGDIMPHADKFNELNYLMNCLRNRSVPLK